MFSDTTLQIIDRGVYVLKTHPDARNDSWHQSTVFVKFDAALKEIFGWKSKEEYLAWRKAWKETYRATSLMSRRWKARRKHSHPEHDDSAVMNVNRLRTNAHALLWIRAEGKKRSWAQRLEAARMRKETVNS